MYPIIPNYTWKAVQPLPVVNTHETQSMHYNSSFLYPIAEVSSLRQIFVPKLNGVRVLTDALVSATISIVLAKR